MKKLGWPGTIAALTVAALSAPVFAGDVTVGRFYMELARNRQLVSKDAASAESALRGAGLALPRLALDKSLTEGDLISISSALGVAVTTQHPTQLISEPQMKTFIGSFGSHTESSQAGNSKGGGKKKGHHKSSSEPI